MQGFKHIINAVNTLLPTELLILAILVTLNRVKHSAYNHPLASAAIVGHAACGVAPYATSIFIILAVATAIDGCPIVVGNRVCGNLCACLIYLNELGYCCGLGHSACAVILNKSGLWTTEFTYHVKSTRNKCCGTSQHRSLVIFDVSSSRCNNLFEITIVHTALVISRHILESEEVRIALVYVEVCLAVEIGIFGKRGCLCAFFLSDAVVRAEQCTGNTINGGVQLLAAVSVEYLCRGHVVSTQSQLHVVHLLHQCTVIRTGTVRIVHLDSDGADRGAAVLDAYLLLCSEFHCLVVLGKNGFVAVIHLAHLFACMQHDNTLGFL